MFGDVMLCMACLHQRRQYQQVLQRCVHLNVIIIIIIITSDDEVGGIRYQNMRIDCQVVRSELERIDACLFCSTKRSVYAILDVRIIGHEIKWWCWCFIDSSQVCEVIVVGVCEVF